MKKFINYYSFLIIFLFFIGIIGFGAIVKYHHDGGKKYQFLQKSVMIIASVPHNIREMIRHRSLNLNKIINAPPKLTKHKDKKRFQRFISSSRDALLILPRYDHSLNRSIIEVLNLDNFEVIHTYKHDIKEMTNQIRNIEKYPELKVNNSPIRFQYRHPLLLNDGSIISNYELGPAYKIDLCSNLKWINDEEIFHHSKMFDHEGNIWITGKMYPYSKFINRYAAEDNDNEKIFENDSLIKIDINRENVIIPKEFEKKSITKPKIKVMI